MTEPPPRIAASDIVEVAPPQASLSTIAERTSLAPPSEASVALPITTDWLGDQAKTYLAILGCCAVLLHALKILGTSDAKKK